MAIFPAGNPDARVVCEVMAVPGFIFNQTTKDMFQNGQQVVCVDDQFDPWVYDLYTSLPKRNQVYTVRAMGAGRSNPQFSLTDDAKLTISGADFDILLLLVELNNPDDPHSSIKQELGFRAERFAPMQEDLDEMEEVELVGFGEEAKGWNTGG